MTEPKHAKEIEYTPEDEKMVSIPESVLINTSSYYETLGGVSKARQQNLATSDARLLSDFISCLDVIKQAKTHKLTVTVTTDKQFRAKLITKYYVYNREDYNRFRNN